jgi:hypothetical protein
VASNAINDFIDSMSSMTGVVPGAVTNRENRHSASVRLATKTKEAGSWVLNSDLVLHSCCKLSIAMDCDQHKKHSKKNLMILCCQCLCAGIVTAGAIAPMSHDGLHLCQTNLNWLYRKTRSYSYLLHCSCATRKGGVRGPTRVVLVFNS